MLTPASNYYEMFMEKEPVGTLVDTALSHHDSQDEAKQVCTNIQIKAGPPVTGANGNTIASHSEAKVHLSIKLSDIAQHGFVFNDLKKCSLISIGQLCDDDCIIFFQIPIKNSKKQYNYHHRQTQSKWSLGHTIDS